MDKIKFLHIADIHFDSKFIGLNEDKKSIRRIETQMTLKRVLSENADVKFVLLAGDLFDGEYNESTVIFLCKLIKENLDKQFFLVGGNHDYLSQKSIKSLQQKKLKNLHIFSDYVDCITLDDCNVKIYGCSFSSPHLFSSLLNGFKASDDNYVNIMLMHGDVGICDKYNPIDSTEIANSNLGYLALGHRHKFSGFLNSGKTTYAYPGILEPRGFDECGICGVIKGIIENKNIDLTFLPYNKRSYEIVEIDITGMVNDTDVIEAINNQISENNFYKINLIGKRSKNVLMNFSVYEELVKAFYCEFFDLTSADIDIFDYIGENSIRGKAASILNTKISENYFENEAVMKKTIEILTDVLCREGKNNDNKRS